MHIPSSLCAVLLIFASLEAVLADTSKPEVTAFIESSCIHCHDASTETGLNFESLGHDLSDADTARKWEQVFDRTQSGEMPPESEERPDVKQLESALTFLEQDLTRASLAKQAQGRVPARRLTKLELKNTLQDLLMIDVDATTGIPDEVESGSFDTIGLNQRISAVHMDSYLQAADEALSNAIQLGQTHTETLVISQIQNSPFWMNGMINRSIKVAVSRAK